MSDYNTKLAEALAKVNKKTNADRIRGMSDEELARWLMSMIRECDLSIFRCKDYCNGNNTCIEAWTKWLKQEAE